MESLVGWRIHQDDVSKNYSVEYNNITDLSKSSRKRIALPDEELQRFRTDTITLMRNAFCKQMLTSLEQWLVGGPISLSIWEIIWKISDSLAVSGRHIATRELPRHQPLTSSLNSRLGEILESALTLAFGKISERKEVTERRERKERWKGRTWGFGKIDVNFFGLKTRWTFQSEGPSKIFVCVCVYGLTAYRHVTVFDISLKNSTGRDRVKERGKVKEGERGWNE